MTKAKGYLAAALVAIVGYAVRYIGSKDTPVVTISNGDLVGFVSRSREGSEFFQFLGIPYATPPLGPLRFEPPQPAKKWEGVRKAKRYGSMCIHINSLSRGVDGKEDCLYLNIFTPKFEENPKKSGQPLLPVFVYVHGGYFMAGGSNYMGPYYLMEEKIVLVTINYRLAAMGFLNTEDGAVAGNMGLKDQIMALRFIKNEIENFGGDPNNVVLWGRVLGQPLYISTCCLPCRKLIMSSGTAIKPWSLVLHPGKQAEHLAKTLNCSIANSKSMVECLKGMDAKTLVATHIDALDTPIMDPLKIFAPSIEVNVKDPSTAFLTEHPYDILTNGKANRVPLLTGVNSHEGLLATARIYHNKTLAKIVESNWDDLSSVFFFYEKSLVDITNKIRQFYFGVPAEKMRFYKQFINFTHVFSDRLYIQSMRETVMHQSQYSPVYAYYFSYPLERGLTFFYDVTPSTPVYLQIGTKVVNEWVKKAFGIFPHHFGTCHGDELVLLFNFPMTYIDVRDKDYEMSRQMIQTLVQFAKDESKLVVGKVPWTPVDALQAKEGKLQYMNFGNDTTHGSFIDEPFSDRMAFWDSLNLPWKMILGLLALLFIDISFCGDAPVVEIVNGRIKGEEKESRDDREFYAYRGIPYAKPPIGNLRFEAPQKADNWTGVWDGEDYGKKCIQWSSYEKEVDGDENCLFINVFTPKIADGISKRLLPVLVFIHGGEFMTGTAEIYRAHYFMDQDVVVATFNYRLGAFGLFKKAILQSSTSLKYTSIQTRPLEAAHRLARKLKCGEVLSKREDATEEVTLGDVLNNTAILVECLKTVKAKKIAEIHEEAFSPLIDPLSMFIPTIEKPLKHYNDTSELPFLTEHPFSLLLANKQAKIPMIVGFNEQEGLVTTGVILNDKPLVAYVEDNWDEVSSQLLNYPRSRTDITKRIKRFYLAGKDYAFDSGNGTAANATGRPVVPVPPSHPHPPAPVPAQALTNKNQAAPLHNQIHTSPTTVPVLIPTTTAAPTADDDDDDLTISFEEQFKSFTNLFTDRYFVWPIFETIRLQLASSSSSSRIYAYENMYEGQHTLLDVYTGKSKEPAPAMKKVKNWFKTNILGRKVQAPKHLGVCFGDELPLLFKYPDLKIKENTKDYDASKELVKLWVQFATDDTRMTYNNRTWTPVNGPSGSYNLMRFHNIPEQSGMKEMSESLKRRLQFWNSLVHLPTFNQ
ncbi:Venom carboxylesterase-6 [Orchesella cincta]|uniref:Venom carboxylesterase-6 n=1 Tax=Orchesella cincta TaxID=48709 RepID=A0A1D2NMV8_ORCCI|nr:Venom carboxylesterase-6 [Orchesella cincta]